VDVAKSYRAKHETQTSRDCSTWLCHFNISLVSDQAIDDNCFLNRPTDLKRLPSSLDAKTSATSELKSSAPKMTASVSYNLQTSLRRGGALLTSRVQKIHIFECSQVAPPLVIEDFGQEYKLCQEISLRRHFFQKVGRMVLRANQPEAFIFFEPTAVATAKVLLDVAVFADREYFEDCGPQPSFDTSIDWNIQSATFACMQLPESVPTLQQVRNSLSTACVLKSITSHHLKTKWADWTRTSPTSASAKFTKWSAKYPIWLSMQSSSTLPPTFSMPYLSRRYTILLQIRISGPCRGRTTLKLPVQVVYQTNQTSQSPPPPPMTPTYTPNAAPSSLLRTAVFDCLPLTGQE
jgi:hypothetical protein